MEETPRDKFSRALDEVFERELLDVNNEDYLNVVKALVEDLKTEIDNLESALLTITNHDWSGVKDDNS